METILLKYINFNTVIVAFLFKSKNAMNFLD